nr:MAG TPA: hypothetical protein [Caudoviricetes sp.]
MFLKTVVHKINNSIFKHKNKRKVSKWNTDRKRRLSNICAVK